MTKEQKYIKELENEVYQLKRESEELEEEGMFRIEELENKISDLEADKDSLDQSISEAVEEERDAFIEIIESHCNVEELKNKLIQIIKDRYGYDEKFQRCFDANSYC